MHVLEVKEITRRFPDLPHPAVDSVSFRVEPGEIFGLLGPSGCGKTTTLRIIAGFESPDSGTVLIREREVLSLPPERRKVGFVFQDYALFPHLSVIRNVMFAMKGTPARLRETRAAELLRMVGLIHVDHRMPDELSGGQQQRVAIARALGADPQLLLMDEPFSNLDVALRDTTRREVRALLKEQGLNAILVTHDQEEALSFCDRLAVMNAGKVEQVGKPEEVYHHPRTAFVAQFLGRANLFEGDAEGTIAHTALGPLLIRPEAHGRVLLSLRPEHIVLTRGDGGSQEGEVVAREFRGHDLTYRVRYQDRSIVAHTDYTHSFYPGQRVQLTAREAAVVLRDLNGRTASNPGGSHG